MIEEPPAEDEEAQEVFQEEPAPVNPIYAWPLNGEVDRFHDPDTLRFDDTMGDWRTHEGIDILAPLGETVLAAHAGKVESIRRDGLFGTVVTVSHGDGFCTVYANLAEETAVSAGDWVEPGDLIGTVGDSASASIRPVTTALPSFQVSGLWQSLSNANSLSTAEATLSSTTSSACRP